MKAPATRLTIALPDNWLTDATSQGVVLTACDENGRSLGSVTVNSAVRAFELGAVQVRRVNGNASTYVGLGWQARLYQDAAAALAAAVGIPVPKVAA